CLCDITPLHLYLLSYTTLFRSRLDSVMCRRMAAGCLCWHFLLGEALRLSRMPDCVAGALHLGDTPLLSKLYVGTSENSVHLRQSDRKSTRLNSSHEWISYAVFC